MNTLETAVVIISAVIPVLVAFRKGIHEIVECIKELRTATLIAKREATKAKNHTDSARDAINAELAKVRITLQQLTQDVGNLETDVKDLTFLVHHRITHTDEQNQLLEERIETLEKAT